MEEVRLVEGSFHRRSTFLEAVSAQASKMLATNRQAHLESSVGMRLIALCYVQGLITHT
jgi:hypothetical protein